MSLPDSVDALPDLKFNPRPLPLPQRFTPAALAHSAANEDTRLLDPVRHVPHCRVQHGAVRWPTVHEPTLLLLLWLRGQASWRIDERSHRIRQHTLAAVVLDPDHLAPSLEASLCSRRLMLWLPCRQLVQLADDEGHAFCRQLTAGKALWQIAASGETLRCGTELAACLDDPGASNLLRDAKSLEFLARVLACRAQRTQHTPDAAECAALEHARRVLLSNLERAATLQTLSRACGLNAFQVKRGFVALYGLSPHAVFQKARMDEAWQLIQSGAMDVSAAGHHLGYSNLSHFSEQFRRHHGVLPSALKRCGAHARTTTD